MTHVSPADAPVKRRVLNLKAVVTIVAVLITAVGGSHWLHTCQLESAFVQLQQQAGEALAGEEPLRALDLFEQLQLLKPDNPAVEEKIAVLLEEHGPGQKSLLRAFQINERLLEDKSRDDLRIRQIYIADRLRRYADAGPHLKHLRELDSPLSDVWYFSGLVAEGIGQTATAIEYYRHAVSLEDPNTNAFARLAKLLTEADERAQAERYLEQLIADDDSADARLVRAGWLLNEERPVDAIFDLKQALAYSPADVTANGMLLQAVRSAAAMNASFDASSQYGLIVLHLSEVLACQPEEESRLRLYLSSALWAEGSRDAAIKTLRNGIERDPQAHRLREMLVDYLINHERLAEAQSAFDELPSRAISQGRRKFMEGRLQLAQGDYQSAFKLFENALALAGDDGRLASRSRICMALCQRNSGNDVRELDTYRDLIKTNPKFQNGRLGLAAAYVRNNQISLAISEYRQLMHVDGVPKYLAGLMIRYQLSLPPRERDWSEVQTLVMSDDSPVTDVVERTLFQADLNFAMGYPSRGMDVLDIASRRFPDNQKISQAVRQLTSSHAEGLNQRILKLLEEDPSNLEAHISILRLQLAREDSSDMEAWLQRLASGDACQSLSRIERLLVIAEAATTVAEAEITVRQASDQTTILLNNAGEAWKQICESTPAHYSSYARFLAIHRSADSAFDTIRNAKQIPPGIKSLALVECLRQKPDDREFQTEVGNELVALINAEPANMDLRLAYADALLTVGEHKAAEQMLTELSESAQDARAFGRLAWMAVFVSEDQETALKMSEAATLRQPADTTIRSIRALALAESGQAEQALEVLRSIPKGRRSPSSLLYEARAQQLAGRDSAAAKMVQYLMLKRAALAAPEVSLLKRMQEQLGVTTPRMSRR